MFKMKTTAILAIFIALVCDIGLASFINPYPRFERYYDGGDPGPALFLTPLIRNASIDRNDIRKLAQVKGSQFLNVESYSGYLTVEPKYNSSLFFWYFPAEKDPNYAPVLLWLQGGPGSSSMFGLFAENGPFEIQENGELKKRQYTWSATHNLIYIDNPVGTGFSFTDSEDGYLHNEKQVGHYLHEAVMQLYELFNWESSGGFFISGESYAGKYVPALAYNIHHAKNRLDTRVHIPLKGLAIGNGLSDPLHQLFYGDYLYELGLIDDNGLRQYHEIEKKGTDCIKKRDLKCALDAFVSLIDGDSDSLFNNLTGYSWIYNYLNASNNSTGRGIGEFLQATEIRKAIHVGNMSFHDADEVNKVEQHLELDMMDSVAQWIAELLSVYPVCIYNGQMDIIVAYPLTRNYLKSLKFDQSSYYKVAPREIWRVDNEIAGYKKQAGNLLEVMVRNAGHMAPLDQPKWMWALISSFTQQHIN